MGLRLRIFLGMLLIVLLALASTGVVAYYHAQRQDIAYNEQRLERKEAALSRSLDYLLNRHESQLTNEEIAQIFTDKICELADVHSLVFSLYTLDGALITTSSSTNEGASPPGNIPVIFPFSTLKSPTTDFFGSTIVADLISKELLFIFYHCSMRR